MKIVGVSASPRPQSNSKIVLEKALESAEAKGAETELFELNKLTISACQGDDFCKTHAGECAINDDMKPIYEALKEADAFILSSPIYMYQLSAQAKIFIDRLYAFFETDFTKTYGNKKVSLIITQGFPNEKMFESYLKVTTDMFKQILDFEVVDVEVFGGNNEPAGIESKEDQIARAVKLGENLTN